MHKANVVAKGRRNSYQSPIRAGITNRYKESATRIHGTKGLFRPMRGVLSYSRCPSLFLCTDSSPPDTECSARKPQLCRASLFVLT